MKIKQFYIFIILLLQSCVYDPPQLTLKVKNRTNHVIYAFPSCSDTLQLNSPFLPFHFFSARTVDASGKNIKDTIFPPNRVKANSTGNLPGWGYEGLFGIKKHYFIPCKNDTVTFFFFDKNVLYENEWERIVNHNLYKEKIRYSKEQLLNMNWTLVYPIAI